MVTAPGPDKLIPGGRYSVDFAVHSTVDKFCDHNPLSRQVGKMGRAGLEITTQTLFDQQAALAEHLEPTWEKLWELALAEDVLHADAGIPYRVPEPRELSNRLGTVLKVVYLVFNEGYSASSGPALTRPDLSAEAIRLGRLLVELLPEPEAIGLLALMLLHDSRRAARTSPQGDLVLLEDQDRSLWDRAQIEEGQVLTRRALAAGPAGPYALQAAIAAVHSEAGDPAATDWAQIVALYDVLLCVGGSSAGRSRARRRGV